MRTKSSIWLFFLAPVFFAVVLLITRYTLSPAFSSIAHGNAVISDTSADFYIYPIATVGSDSVRVQAADFNGRLYILNFGNNRILIYDRPSASDTLPDYVLGQPNFVSSTADSTSLSGLYHPGSVAVDTQGRVYVAEAELNRIKVFENPITTDTVADFYIYPITGVGQESVSVGATDFNGRLYIASYQYNRVLIYDRPSASDTLPDYVLGQPNFVSSTADSISLSGLYHPSSVVVDTQGRVYVSETPEVNRIKVFDAVITEQQSSTTTTTTTTIPPSSASTPSSSSGGGCLITRLNAPDWLIEMIRGCRNITLSSGRIGRLVCAIYYFLSAEV